MIEHNNTSFSNGHTTEERFMLNLTHPPQINTKNKIQDDEIGIFGAEKYFKGDIDEQLLTTLANKAPARNHSNEPQQKHEERCPESKPKTPSVRSESSWNSRRGLLVSNEPSRNNHRRKNSVKSLLSSLGCNCNDKGSVKITDNRVHVKEVAKKPVKTSDSGQKTNRWADEDLHVKKFEFNETKTKREDCFSFPVLDSPATKMPETGRARRSSPEVFGSPVKKKSFSLERKLTMLNWDGVTPRAENIDALKNGDAGSDASSDLFEIESFSTNENNSFLARQVTENSDGRLSNVNGYAPSEVSVDWSVVTVEDTCAPKIYKSIKPVRFSGDGCGDEAAVEWRRRLDSGTPVAKIQADTKLLGNGRASRHLYVQQ